MSQRTVAIVASLLFVVAPVSISVDSPSVSMSTRRRESRWQRSAAAARVLEAGRSVRCKTGVGSEQKLEVGGPATSISSLYTSYCCAALFFWYSMGVRDPARKSITGAAAKCDQKTRQRNRHLGPL